MGRSSEDTEHRALLSSTMSTRQGRAGLDRALRGTDSLHRIALRGSDTSVLHRGDVRSYVPRLLSPSEENTAHCTALIYVCVHEYICVCRCITA
jgi:hypothetical protein